MSTEIRDVVHYSAIVTFSIVENPNKLIQVVLDIQPQLMAKFVTT